MDMAIQFSIGSNGILSRCILYADGWGVKILKPHKKRESLNNPGSYYYRKGYFSLNVKVVVDNNKKVILRSII